MSERIVSSRSLTSALLALAVGAGVALSLAPTPVRADDAPVRSATAATGADLFSQNCVACHGPKGDGDGPAAAGLTPKPRKLSGKDVMSKLSDSQITTVIKNGGQSVGKSPLMPAFAHLSDAQIKSLVAHIRALCSCDFKP